MTISQFGEGSVEPFFQTVTGCHEPVCWIPWPVYLLLQYKLLKHVVYSWPVSKIYWLYEKDVDRFPSASILWLVFIMEVFMESETSVEHCQIKF